MPYVHLINEDIAFELHFQCKIIIRWKKNIFLPFCCFRSKMSPQWMQWSVIIGQYSNHLSKNQNNCFSHWKIDFNTQNLLSNQRFQMSFTYFLNANTSCLPLFLGHCNSPDTYRTCRDSSHVTPHCPIYR